MVEVPAHRSASLFVILLLGTAFAFPGFAAVSAAYQEWRNGPVQWIMTADEQRAWRSVSDDAGAISFIDLFWVRRDPTPGTPQNEFRSEFESRVATADRLFSEDRKRGALTDRGRVYIVLGPTRNMAAELRTSSGQMGLSTGGVDPTGGRTMGARDVWVWERSEALKLDMPKIEVVFIEDPVTRKVQRDPQRGDFIRANGVAIQKAIVNPDIKELPEWAPRGGLEQRVLLTAPAGPPVAVPSIRVPAPVLEEEAPAPAPVAAAEGSSALKLVLTKGKPLDLSSPDPVGAATSVKTFASRDTVIWAAQFCSPRAEIPRLKYIVVISGPFDGDSSDRVTKEKDAKLVALREVPGCYLLQGSIALPKLARGRYEIGLLVDDAVTWDSYKVQQAFRVE